MPTIAKSKLLAATEAAKAIITTARKCQTMINKTWADMDAAIQLQAGKEPYKMEHVSLVWNAGLGQAVEDYYHGLPGFDRKTKNRTQVYKQNRTHFKWTLMQRASDYVGRTQAQAGKEYRAERKETGSRIDHGAAESHTDNIGPIRLFEYGELLEDALETLIRSLYSRVDPALLNAVIEKVKGKL